MTFDATFWVGIAFVVFIGVLVYYKVPGMLSKALDDRAGRIRGELDQARELREEAQTLLASYERRQRDAQKEAEDMIAFAREEAKRETELAQVRLTEQIARREQLALQKIRLAEAAAEREVRDAAVEVALRAAEAVIRETMTGERATDLIDRSIADVRQHLN